MGLLDDAIREHLDLKRRRGADPAEVARMEQEALGPVRREPAPAEAAPADDAREFHDEPVEAAHPASAETHDRPTETPHALPPEERHDPPHGDPLFEHHESEPEPAPAHHEDPVLQPTTEYRVEDHEDADEHAPEPHADEHAPEPHADEHAPEPHAAAHPDDDVLEETPDFLQETPEHDRLWFEQRPPRDFDFDG